MIREDLEIGLISVGLEICLIIGERKITRYQGYY